MSLELLGMALQRERESLLYVCVDAFRFGITVCMEKEEEERGVREIERILEPGLSQQLRKQPAMSTVEAITFIWQGFTQNFRRGGEYM